MTSIPVSIVIVHYKTEASTLSLIKNLSQIKEIIVIDNSQSKTLEKKLQPYQNCQVVINSFNTGFAHACNQGLLLSSLNHVLFLNSDLEINLSQIKQLLKILKEKKLTALAPTFLNGKGELDPNYRKPIPNFISLLTEFSPLHKFMSQPAAPLTLAGACLLVDKDQFLEIGAWDEQFFIWFEDSDLSKRLLDDGHPFEVTDQVEIIHQGGESFENKASKWKLEVFFLSLRVFSKKYFSFAQHQTLKKLTHRFSKNNLYPLNKDIRASIIVPNMRGELLDKFIEDNYHFFDFTQDELIIVSSAEQKWELRRKYPQIIFIYITRNKGFAPTVNTGFRRATGKWIGTINDDVILEKDWLKNLISEADLYVKENKIQVGSISPIVENPGNKIESFGVNVLKHGKALKNTTINQHYKSTNAFNAAVVLLNREALTKLGFFDETFGSYLEDLDLGLRMSKNNYANITTDKVKILHLGQQTSGQMPIYKSWWDVKNWWLLTIKHTSLIGWLKYGPQIILERLRNLSGLAKAIYIFKIKMKTIS